MKNSSGQELKAGPYVRAARRVRHGSRINRPPKPRHRAGSHGFVDRVAMYGLAGFLALIVYLVVKLFTFGRETARPDFRDDL